VSINVEQPNSPEPAGASGDAKEARGKIHSDFIDQLRAKFLGTPPPWPRASVKTREQVLAEISAAFRAMFLRVERSKPIPSAAKGSAVQLVGEVVKATRWPKDNPLAKVPDHWKDNVRTFRRYEIAAAMDVLMQAFNASGGGGSGSEWPPDRP
jgi:hypothetical protein